MKSTLTYPQTCPTESDHFNPSAKKFIMRKFVRILFHQALSPLFLFLIRNKEVWYFEGIRRSGNHAAIYWVANSILSRRVEPEQLTHYSFYRFADKIFWINSYAQESALSRVMHLWKNRQQLRRSRILFLSIEDKSSDLLHFLNVKSNAHRHIGITRSLPNVLASRLKKLNQESLKPQGGIGGNFVINGEILNLFFLAREAQFVWRYDEWLESPTWRKHFLISLGLTTDIMPELTPHGGGSSFNTENRNNGQNKRFSLIPCPVHLKPILKEILHKLPQKEAEEVNGWMSS